MVYATCSDLDVRFSRKIPSSTSGAYFDLLIRMNVSELTYHLRDAAAQPIKPSQHRRVKMHHTDILTTAARTLNERGEEYGDASVCFDNIARIAGIVLQRVVSPYEVSVFHIATKLGRAAHSPAKADTWIDLANYAAFAGQFATQGQPYTSDPMDADMARIVDIVRTKPTEPTE